jgi:hypothetical protein
MLVTTMAFAWWLVSLPTEGVLPAAAALRDGPAAEARLQRSPVEPDPSAEAPESEAHPTNRTLVRSVLTPEMVHTAQTFLDLPMGAERLVDLDGHHFVFVLERHYHPPGFVGAPTGWHKGVTIYELSNP